MGIVGALAMIGGIAVAGYWAIFIFGYVFRQGFDAGREK